MIRPPAFAANLLCFCAVVLCGCRQGQPAVAANKLALLPIENQTGDASLDWVEHALPAILSNQIGARVVARNWNDARQEGAEGVLTGTLTIEGGRLVIRAAQQSFAGPRTIRMVSASGSASELLRMSTDIAREIDSTVRPSGIKDPGSVQKAGELLNSRTAEELAARCTQFLAVEPLFSPAYETCVTGLSAAGRGQDVERVIAFASGRETNLGFGAKSVIALAHFQIGNLRQAGLFFRSIANEYPESWNQLIYVEGLSGNMKGAQEAFDKYVKTVPPKIANGWDSLGEVYFLGKHYAEAEKSFLASVEKDPNFTGGVDWYKAGASRLAQGNVKGAEELMAKHMAILKARNDPNLAAVSATWQQLIQLGRTGSGPLVTAVEKNLIQRRPVTGN